jgi:hypothetical protein
MNKPLPPTDELNDWLDSVITARDPLEVVYTTIYNCAILAHTENNPEYLATTKLCAEDAGLKKSATQERINKLIDAGRVRRIELGYRDIHYAPARNE